MKYIRTNIYLTKIQKDKLKKISKETGRKAAEIVRNAIDAFVK